MEGRTHAPTEIGSSMSSGLMVPKERFMHWCGPTEWNGSSGWYGGGVSTKPEHSPVAPNQTQKPKRRWPHIPVIRSIVDGHNHNAHWTDNVEVTGRCIKVGR